MSNKSIREVVKIAKSCDSFGDYKLADKFSNLLENYRYAQSQKLTLDNFVDSLFNYVKQNNIRDPNGNVSFVTAFDKYSNDFNANINGVNISQIPQLVNLRNTVLNNPGKRYMPNDLKGLLSGAGENNNNNNNILVSNNPVEFATKLFQFARNNYFSNLTRALESYMGNAFYSGMRINNNKPFIDLYNRVKQTSSVITESMLSNELSLILNSGVNNNNAMNDLTPEQRQKFEQEENNYQSKEAYKEYVELISSEPGNGLESLRGDINRNNYLSQDDKERLIKFLDAYKKYRGVA